MLAPGGEGRSVALQGVGGRECPAGGKLRGRESWGRPPATPEHPGGASPAPLLTSAPTPEPAVFQSLVWTITDSRGYGKAVWGRAWTIRNPHLVAGDSGTPWASSDVTGQHLLPSYHSLVNRM